MAKTLAGDRVRCSATISIRMILKREPCKTRDKADQVQNGSCCEAISEGLVAKPHYARRSGPKRVSMGLIPTDVTQ